MYSNGETLGIGAIELRDIRSGLSQHAVIELENMKMKRQAYLMGSLFFDSTVTRAF